MESDHRQPQLLESCVILPMGLKNLFEYEKGKSAGILNGIDTEVWDPADR